MAAPRKKKSASAKKQARKKSKPTARRTLARKSPAAEDAVSRCGLCGATANLTRTECCGNWICDDEHTYRIFSFARNSCSRNHSRYTLCAYHWNEGHEGRWQDCDECREGFETEIYVYYGTNEYNFETLKNPPKFAPTLCTKCGAVIHLGEGGYSISGKEGYRCSRCTPRIEDL